MKIFRMIIFVLQLATVCFVGAGCESMIDSIGPQKPLYDQILQERQDRWQREDLGVH